MRVLLLMEGGVDGVDMLRLLEGVAGKFAKLVRLRNKDGALLLVHHCLANLGLLLILLLKALFLLITILMMTHFLL